MPTILDVNFGRECFGWPETPEKRGRKICYQNLPSKFAEKFAGNFPEFLSGPEYCRDQNYSGSGKMFPGINF